MTLSRTGRGFVGFLSFFDGTGPSSLAAEAAVGAVAAAGKRAMRVGDLGRGLVNADFGEVGTDFLTGLLAEVLGAWEGFAGAAVAGFETADGRPMGFFTSFTASFFGSLEDPGFGDGLLEDSLLGDAPCLVVAVVLVGVRGSEEIVSRGLLPDASAAVDEGADGSGCVLTAAGGEAASGLLSATSVVLTDTGGGGGFGWLGAGPGAALDLDCGASFDASFSLPLTSPGV